MPLNWRKPIMFALMKGMGSHISPELRFLRSIEYKTLEQIRAVQNERLTNLLRYAWDNTEYYREVLSDCGVVDNGRICLDKFSAIPFLTKDIIRKEFERLRTKQLPAGRKAFSNRTGGSTGEPVTYWQDSHYWDVNVATKLYHFAMNGKRVGELEMKIWGSDRDIISDTKGWTTSVKNFVYNREIRACGHLSDEQIFGIVDDINRLKPRSIWGYTDGIYTIATFINGHGLTVRPPAAIFGGGGTLFPHMVQAIEKAFHAPMINMYGSREMGDVACECREKKGLHISCHSHIVEVIDSEGNPVIEQDGDIAVTSLHNYAMPFFRYRIGDRGRLTTKKCPCGRGFPLLEAVLGRSMESFVTSDGAVVSPIFLITTMTAALDTNAVRKFQLIQEDHRHITLNVVLNPDASGEELRAKLNQATLKLKSIMGQSCLVVPNIVDRIPPTQSGKYLYTVSKLPTKGYSTERGSGP